MGRLALFFFFRLRHVPCDSGRRSHIQDGKLERLQLLLGGLDVRDGRQMIWATDRVDTHLVETSAQKGLLRHVVMVVISNGEFHKHSGVKGELGHNLAKLFTHLDWGAALGPSTKNECSMVCFSANDRARACSNDSRRCSTPKYCACCTLMATVGISRAVRQAGSLNPTEGLKDLNRHES